MYCGIWTSFRLLSEPCLRWSDNAQYWGKSGLPIAYYRVFYWDTDCIHYLQEKVTSLFAKFIYRLLLFSSHTDEPSPNWFALYFYLLVVTKYGIDYQRPNYKRTQIYLMRWCSDALNFKQASWYSLHLITYSTPRSSKRRRRTLNWSGMWYFSLALLPGPIFMTPLRPAIVTSNSSSPQHSRIFKEVQTKIYSA